MDKQIAFALALLSSVSGPASAGLISLSNSTSGIFDATSGTRAVTFTGAEAGFASGTILDIDILVDFIKADGEEVTIPGPPPPGSPFYNEIHFALTGPDANTIELVLAGTYAVGAAGDFFDGVLTFDDEAAATIAAGSTPSVGAFQPTGPGSLSEFYGISALGSWTLSISDTVGADALRFRSFTVNIITDDGVRVPEPATLSLIGAGLLGACGLRRRQRKAISA